MKSIFISIDQDMRSCVASVTITTDVINHAVNIRFENINLVQLLSDINFILTPLYGIDVKMSDLGEAYKRKVDGMEVTTKTYRYGTLLNNDSHISPLRNYGEYNSIGGSMSRLS